MGRIISMLVCCLVFAGVQAQKITRDYNNVSLSEALRQLNEQTEEYTISFLYNELEDFRITTSVHRKTVPDAIRQMIGFYPIHMTVEPSIANPSQQEIIVECPQKTAPRYKGTVVDEQGQPVAYANIALLSPRDSTLIPVESLMKAASLLFPANKNQSLQEYLLSATRRFTSNVTPKKSARYGCSQKR